VTGARGPGARVDVRDTGGDSPGAGVREAGVLVARVLVARNLTRSSVLAERLEPATSLCAKLCGLMGRPALDPGAGMWLPDSNGIHMMFMRFAIDSVFVGRAGPDGARRVVAMRRGLRPWTGVVWLVRGAHGVLELPVGTIDSSGTQPGDDILLEDAG